MPEFEQKVKDEAGFTLIELLIVVAIIGILSAIALPGLLSQRKVADDGAAKVLMRDAVNTAINYSLTKGYSGMSPAALNAINRTLNTTPNGDAVLVNATPTGNGYILSVVSSSANTFNVTSVNGSLTRTCLIAAGNGNVATNTGEGCHNGTW